MEVIKETFSINNFLLLHLIHQFRMTLLNNNVISKSLDFYSQVMVPQEIGFKLT